MACSENVPEARQDTPRGTSPLLDELATWQHPAPDKKYATIADALRKATSQSCRGGNLTRDPVWRVGQNRFGIHVLATQRFYCPKLSHVPVSDHKNVGFLVYPLHALTARAPTDGYKDYVGVYVYTCTYKYLYVFMRAVIWEGVYAWLPWATESSDIYVMPGSRSLT